MRGAVCLALLAVTSYVAGDAPLVRTPLGNVTGSVRKSRDQREFYAYTSLPYAKPPVGELRFKEPQPVSKWNDTLNATRLLPRCPSYDTDNKVIGQEDCLYLNVYTRNVTGKAPVLVHIHGGAFINGWGGSATPHSLMGYKEDMVIVSINYRLGILGFLSLEDDTLPGNLGLKDQTAALRWVKENIASFGGDPGRVTLIGESAGGASVYSHILSPLSKGLFHGVISESGTPYSTWALAAPGTARPLALRLLKYLNCSTESSEQAVKCLRKKDVKQILDQQGHFMVWEMDPLVVWRPVMEPKSREGGFFVGPVKEWKHEQVPLIIGTTSAEGLLRTLPMLNDTDAAFQTLSKNFTGVAPASLCYDATSSKGQNVSEKVRQYYFGGSANITLKDWVNLTNMYSDAWFTNSLIEGANTHSGPVYVYQWDYILKSSTPKNIDRKLIFGANHVTECVFIWYEDVLATSADFELAKKMVDIVGNFVTTGSPGGKNNTLKWEKWSEKEHNYLLVNRTGGLTPASGLGPLEQRYNFWKSLPYRDLIDNAFPNSASLTTTVSSLICFSVLFNIARILVV